jgi:hypothetical protein
VKRPGLFTWSRSITSSRWRQAPRPGPDVAYAAEMADALMERCLVSTARSGSTSRAAAMIPSAEKPAAARMSPEPREATAEPFHAWGVERDTRKTLEPVGC